MRVDDKLSESLIALTREGGFWRDRLRAYRVRIDGQSAGIIHEYETLEVAVEPGHHEVQLRLDWGTSPKISIEVEEGKIHFLQCRPGSFFGLLIPGIYLDLEPDHPPVQWSWLGSLAGNPNFAQCFELDTLPLPLSPGAEVFALIRETPLDKDAYVQSFVRTGREYGR